MTKVDLNFEGFDKKLSEEAFRKGRQSLANQALADMNQYVPRKVGILRITGTINIDGSAINYNQPYASAQFYNKYENYTTPGTGSRWDLKAESNHMDDWEKAFLGGAGI